jgi:hypothetical protein
MENHLFVQLFHVFIVSALFLYVGIMRTSIPLFLFRVLFFLGIFIFFYHTYKAYIRLSKGLTPWVNYIHMFLIAPLLIIIGYNNVETKRFYFELLLMFAFASLGYHSYYAIKGE